jgi:hypothetical protein
MIACRLLPSGRGLQRLHADCLPHQGEDFNAMHRLFELSGTKLIAWSPPVPLAAVRHFKLPACSRACFRALECRRWPLMTSDGL